MSGTANPTVLPEATVVGKRPPPAIAGPPGKPGFFAKKKLDFTFRMGEGSFGNSGSNTIKITGLRASMHLARAGETSMGEMQLRIWGLTFDHMNELSTLGRFPYIFRNNTIMIEAGDDNTGMGVVYNGYIVAAWADFTAMPDVVFYVLGQNDLIPLLASTEPTSFKGTASVATIMAGLATRMGYNFVNSGVTATITDQYLAGSIVDQIRKLEANANIVVDLDDTAHVLTIWPEGGSKGGKIPLISPESGMVGYPTYTSRGIVCTVIFSAGTINYGQMVEVKSALKPACGQWYVYKVVHELEAQIPNGNWFTRFEATNPMIMTPAPLPSADGKPLAPGAGTGQGFG